MKNIRKQLTGNSYIRIFRIFPLLVGWLISRFMYKGKQTIILVGSNRGISYTDNGKAMHQYLLRNQPELKTYWISNKKNKEFYDFDTVTLGSIRSYILYFRAKVVFYTHSNSSDIAPLVGHFDFFKQPKKIFISHGIEGLKKRLNVKLEDADVYTCASEKEKAIKNKLWNIPNEKLVVTGVARYDRLFDFKDNFSSKQIQKVAYIPTWREWDLISEEKDFKKSRTYKEISDFMKDKQLERFLSENNLILLVKLHPFFEKFSKDLKNSQSEHVQITTTSIDDLIIKCAMLITDYSSICWDFFYQKKPVYFYQFDYIKFNKARGSYFEISDFIPSNCISSTKENIYENLTKTFKEVDEQSKLEKFLPPFDNKNCERIFNSAWESAAK